MARAWNPGHKDIMRGIFRRMNTPHVSLKQRRSRMRGLPNVSEFRFDFYACDESEISVRGDSRGERAATTEYLQRLKWWHRTKAIPNRERANGRFHLNDLVACIDPHFRPSSERLENGAACEIDDWSSASGGTSLRDMVRAV